VKILVLLLTPVTDSNWGGIGVGNLCGGIS
jgi:hypothetical protein